MSQWCFQNKSINAMRVYIFAFMPKKFCSFFPTYLSVEKKMLFVLNLSDFFIFLKSLEEILTFTVKIDNINVFYNVFINLLRVYRKVLDTNLLFFLDYTIHKKHFKILNFINLKKLLFPIKTHFSVFPFHLLLIGCNHNCCIILF